MCVPRNNNYVEIRAMVIGAANDFKISYQFQDILITGVFPMVCKDGSIGKRVIHGLCDIAHLYVNICARSFSVYRCILSFDVCFMFL